MREPDGYREQLEFLANMYPGKLFLTMNEASTLADRDRRTLLKDKTFPAKRNGQGHINIPIAAFAKWSVTTKH